MRFIRFTGFWALAGGLLLFVSVAAAQDRLEETIDEEFDLGKGGRIRLVNDEGSVTVTAWNKKYVSVKAVKRVYARSEREAERALEELDVRMDLRGKTLDIRVYEPERHFKFSFGRRNWRSNSVDFTIKAPKEVSLDFEVDESDVMIEGTEGAIEVRLDEGDLEIKNIKSDRIVLQADEGFIQLENLSILEKDGELDVRITVDEGRVYIRDAILTSLDIRADEGDIQTKETRLREMYVQVDEGDLFLDVVPTKSCRLRLRSDEGDIELTLPEDASLGFDLFSEEGRIRTDFDIPVERDEDESSARGKIGGGSGSLRISTDEGNITVYKK